MWPGSPDSSTDPLSLAALSKICAFFAAKSASESELMRIASSVSSGAGSNFPAACSKLARRPGTSGGSAVGFEGAGIIVRTPTSTRPSGSASARVRTPII